MVWVVTIFHLVNLSFDVYGHKKMTFFAKYPLYVTQLFKNDNE